MAVVKIYAENLDKVPPSNCSPGRPMDYETILFEAVLAALSERLAEPSDQFPSVRCVTRPALRALLTQIRREFDPGAAGVTAGDLLDRLTRSAVIAPVPLTGAAPRVGLDRFVVVGLGTDPDTAQPVELLQAHVPNGVVCYFTALAVHGLTSQPTAHHHVARFSKPAGAGPAATQAPGAGPERPQDRPAPLGQWQFTFQGAPYYLTSRDPRYLRATQTRYLSESSRFQVTTLEQTLLDTLHRPISCGGPAVVFEAWDTAAARLRVPHIATLLRQIADDRLCRRTGYMLERIGLALPAEFACGGGAPRRAPLGEQEEEPRDALPSTLLAGMPYTVVDHRWGLLVP